MDLREANFVQLSTKRIVLFALGAVVVASVVYFAVLLVAAHRMTSSVVAKARALEARDVRIEELPAEWTAILLAVEDPGFFEHRGFDLTTPGAGLTTITQGLVKTHYFERFRPGPLAKLKQTLFAIVLDRQLAKRSQLTLMLHTARLGSSGTGPVVGFPAGARAYFGKGLAGLSREEFVSLVAMLVGPGAYHPLTHPTALAERVARIEALLAGSCEPEGVRDVYYRGCAR